jgi:hypothetical protein
VAPPSIANAGPVTKRDTSLSRKATDAATSLNGLCGVRNAEQPKEPRHRSPAPLDRHVAGALRVGQRPAAPQDLGQRRGVGLDRGVGILGAAAGELGPAVRDPSAEDLVVEA